MCTVQLPPCRATSAARDASLSDGQLELSVTNPDHGTASEELAVAFGRRARELVLEPLRQPGVVLARRVLEEELALDL